MAQTVKTSCNVGDPDSVPELGRSPGEGNGNSFQYSCLEKSMDREAWQGIVHGVAKTWAQLSNFHFHTSTCKIYPNLVVII